MMRSPIIVPLFALLLVASLLANLYLFSEVRGLQQRMTDIESSTTLAERLEAVEAQAAQTQSRLTGLLLAASIGLEEVATQLGTFSDEEIRMVVPIDEEIPINLEVPFSTQLDVPVQAEIPIVTVVDIPIDLGLFGTNDFSVPIETTVPIDLTIPVALDTEVPINTTVPISFDVPITVPLGDSVFGDQVDGWQDALRSFADQLASPEQSE